MTSTPQPPIITLLEMVRFGCPSCSYAIERFGRRQKGVTDIRVDLAACKIRVEHDSNPAAIDSILDYVRLIGHEARRIPD